MRFLSRFCILIFAYWVLPATTFAQFPSTKVQYSPSLKTIQGPLPFIPAAVPDPINPVNPYTLTIASPIGITYPRTVTVTFNIATAGNVVGGVKILPAGVSDATALSYIHASPSTLTFTSPNQSLSTVISIQIDATQSQTAVPGDYGWVINTTGWPASVVVTDPLTGGPLGAAINLTAAPLPPTPVPPTISNLVPANGTPFVYDPPTTGPIVFPISFDANVVGGAATDKITSLSATIDGDSFNGINAYSRSAANPQEVLAALVTTGSGTLSAHGAVMSPSITDGGPHTITVTAYSATTPSVSRSTTINVRTPPKFTSANHATFTIGQAGSFTVTATGFPSPTFFALPAGALPAGMSFDPTTGILSGTPTTGAGTRTLTFTASNLVRDVTQTFTLTINKATPVINWANPAAITYGTALSSNQLNATATVGATVVAGNMSYSPAAAAVLSAGTQTLNVSFTPTNSTDYNAATGSVSILVNKAVLKVTADNATRVYGTANSAFSATISGFVNGDLASVVTGAAALATTATVASPVGNYSITAALGTLAASNYTFGFASGTLVVTPAPLTVTANNATRAFGVANPSFSATITGFVNGDTAVSSVTGVPAFTTTATIASSPSTYPITPSVGTLASSKYAFTSFVAGLLTVNKADQTISFGALASRALNSGNFTLTATASSGLTVSYTSSNPAVATVSGNTVTLLSAGTTDITASQGGDTNYNSAAAVVQTLTVTAPQACATGILWLPPISLSKVQEGGSVLPIKFNLQQCCDSTARDPDANGDLHSRDHNGHGDDNNKNSDDDADDGDHDTDFSGKNVSCHHGKDGKSSSDKNCRHDCDHDDEDHDGCVNLRDTTVVISIYEVGSAAPATQYKYGTGSPNPPDYVINGNYKYQLNFPTAKGKHTYHIDVYRFPAGATAPVLVGANEFSTK